MNPVKSVSGIALPLYQANIDTDAIIPSRVIRDVSKAGLGSGLFRQPQVLTGRYHDQSKFHIESSLNTNRPAF